MIRILVWKIFPILSVLEGRIRIRFHYCDIMCKKRRIICELFGFCRIIFVFQWLLFGVVMIRLSSHVIIHFACIHSLPLYSLPSHLFTPFPSIHSLPILFPILSDTPVLSLSLLLCPFFDSSHMKHFFFFCFFHPLYRIQFPKKDLFLFTISI